MENSQLNFDMGAKSDFSRINNDEEHFNSDLESAEFILSGFPSSLEIPPKTRRSPGDGDKNSNWSELEFLNLGITEPTPVRSFGGPALSRNKREDMAQTLADPKAEIEQAENFVTQVKFNFCQNLKLYL